MVAVPAETPVTIPEESTVAIAVFEELQFPPAKVEEKVVVFPAQTVWVPLKVPEFAGAVTVMFLVFETTTLEQPPVPFTV